MGSLAGSLGSIASQAPLVFLIAAISWRNTFRVLAGVSIVLAVLCFKFIKNSPADMGLPTIEEIEGKASRPVIKKARPQVLQVIKRVLKNKQNWPLMIGFSIYMGTHSAFAGTWAVSYIQDVYQYDMVTASKYTTLLLAGMAVGTFSIGFISGALNSRKIPLIVMSAISTVNWALLVFGMDTLSVRPWLLTTVLLLTGFTFSSISLCFSVIREINNPQEVGVSVGFINAFGMLIASFFPTIIGINIDRLSGSALSNAALYRSSLIFIFVLQIVCLICMLVVKETHCKNIYKAVD